MADGNTIKIGGVQFNKADVKSSEVIIKDGKKVNSVFLQDGTHVEFPTQSEENKSSVSQGNRTYSQPAYKHGFNPRSGNVEGHWTMQTKEDSSVKVTKFNRMTGAKITGTENEEIYHLNGCTNSEVDLSQHDGKSDRVYEHSSHTGSLFGGTDWEHGNNTYKLGDSDVADVAGDESSLFPGKHKHYKGEGTFKSEGGHH